MEGAKHNCQWKPRRHRPQSQNSAAHKHDVEAAYSLINEPRYPEQDIILARTDPRCAIKRLQAALAHTTADASSKTCHVHQRKSRPPISQMFMLQSQMTLTTWCLATCRCSATTEAHERQCSRTKCPSTSPGCQRLCHARDNDGGAVRQVNGPW